MTKKVLGLIEQTPTAQLRRVGIPASRRKAQCRQTAWGVVVGVGGMLLVRFLGLSEGWYVAAAFLGLRVASRELLVDSIKIARDLVGVIFRTGGPNGESS